MAITRCYYCSVIRTVCKTQCLEFDVCLHLDPLVLHGIHTSTRYADDFWWMEIIHRTCTAISLSFHNSYGYLERDRLITTITYHVLKIEMSWLTKPILVDKIFYLMFNYDFAWYHAYSKIFSKPCSDWLCNKCDVILSTKCLAFPNSLSLCDECNSI